MVSFSAAARWACSLAPMRPCSSPAKQMNTSVASKREAALGEDARQLHGERGPAAVVVHAGREVVAHGPVEAAAGALAGGARRRRAAPPCRSGRSRRSAAASARAAPPSRCAPRPRASPAHPASGCGRCRTRPARRGEYDFISSRIHWRAAPMPRPGVSVDERRCRVWNDSSFLSVDSSRAGETSASSSRCAGRRPAPRPPAESRPGEEDGKAQPWSGHGRRVYRVSGALRVLRPPVAAGQGDLRPQRRRDVHRPAPARSRCARWWTSCARGWPPTTAASWRRPRARWPARSRRACASSRSTSGCSRCGRGCGARASCTASTLATTAALHASASGCVRSPTSAWSRSRPSCARCSTRSAITSTTRTCAWPTPSTRRASSSARAASSTSSCRGRARPVERTRPVTQRVESAERGTRRPRFDGWRPSVPPVR